MFSAPLAFAWAIHKEVLHEKRAFPTGQRAAAAQARYLAVRL